AEATEAGKIRVKEISESPKKQEIYERKQEPAEANRDIINEIEELKRREVERLKQEVVRLRQEKAEAERVRVNEINEPKKQEIYERKPETVEPDKNRRSETIWAGELRRRELNKYKTSGEEINKEKLSEHGPSWPA
ncbi:MAG: hypothetical protein Q8O66_03760, partial [bacterium]|nr:hypothetical protein [bacterium]